MTLKNNLLSRKEAAEYLGVHPQTLAKWASTGAYQLKYLKIGGRAFYRKSDLEAWLRTRERTQVEV